MLRASMEAHGWDLNLAGIADPAVDSGVPGGATLLAFVDVTVGGAGPVDPIRRAVTDAFGPAGLVRAAAVAANFEMMNRIADGTGMPVPKSRVRASADVIDALELGRLAARHGAAVGPVDQPRGSG